MSDTFAYDVFLSHSSKEKAIVRDIAERLKKDGIKVWFDAWEINPGDSIPAKIEEGLEHSRVLACPAVAYGRRRKSGTFRFRDPLNPAFAKRLRVGRQERRLLPLRLDDAPSKGSNTRL